MKGFFLAHGIFYCTLNIATILYVAISSNKLTSEEEIIKWLWLLNGVIGLGIFAILQRLDNR